MLRRKPALSASPPLPYRAVRPLRPAVRTASDRAVPPPTSSNRTAFPRPCGCSGMRESSLFSGSAAIDRLVHSRALPVGLRSQHQPVHCLHAPALRHEFRGQPVQQFRMGGRHSGAAEIRDACHDAAAEMAQPDLVHHDARRQRMIGLRQPVGQRQPASAGPGERRNRRIRLQRRVLQDAGTPGSTGSPKPTGSPRCSRYASEGSRVIGQDAHVRRRGQFLAGCPVLSAGLRLGGSSEYFAPAPGRRANALLYFSANASAPRCVVGRRVRHRPDFARTSAGSAAMASSTLARGMVRRLRGSAAESFDLGLKRRVAFGDRLALASGARSSSRFLGAFHSYGS